MTSQNRFFNDSFNAPFASLAKSVPLDQQFVLLQLAFTLVAAELDRIAGIAGITSLPGFPASFSGAALKLLRVNAAESAIEFVADGRLNIRSISGTSHTLDATDAGCLLIFTNSSPISVTVPAGVMSKGDVVCIRQGAAGQVTLVASGTTFQSSDDLLSTRTQGAQIALICDNDAATQFGVIGERNAPSLGVALLAVANSFTKGQTVAPVALTDGATISVDASLSNNFYVVIAGTGRTLANPTNLADGQIVNIYVKQNGSGSQTITTYGSLYKWPGGTPPTLSTTANAVDLIVGQYVSTLGILCCNFLKGFA